MPTHNPMQEYTRAEMMTVEEIMAMVEAGRERTGAIQDALEIALRDMTKEHRELLTIALQEEDLVHHLRFVLRRPGLPEAVEALAVCLRNAQIAAPSR